MTLNIGHLKLIKLRGLLAVAVGLMIVALVACGSDPEPTPTPVPASAAAPAPAPAVAATIPATSPTVDELAGGSPEKFGQVFADSAAASSHPPTSEYAAAASLADGETLKIGFIYVGSRKDLGYNQAAFEGSQYLESKIPNIEIIHAENIPETAQVQAVEEQMIQQGAKIIFATSFGYSDPTIELAAKHPDIVFLHQGAFKSTDNFGAYMGNLWQLEYAAGQVAGKVTETNKLGFIAAFPIPQTLLNVNAFQLGAKSVNPDAKTTFVLLNDWCDPAKQASATQTMIAAGIDVLTQHQDCTTTIIEAAEREGVFVSGYHHDASSAAPDVWLTGAVWNWGPIYTEIVSEIMNGSYKASVMFGGLEPGWVKLAPFGNNVPQDVQDLAMKTVEELRSGALNPFTGPLNDQDGELRIEAGETPNDETLQSIDWLVEGVTGSTG
jgi:basic membrane lipoprotein Med (substrate-binding protein (PBP1-ABC) superfamily)